MRGENSKYFKSHPDVSQLGELYLQVMFVPKGVTPNPVMPDLLVDYSKMMAEKTLEAERLLKGILYFKLVFIRGVQLTED